VSRKLGLIGEEKASKFISQLGFIILDKNFYSRFGEIDIIAIKDDTLHFIEVKSGKNSNYAITKNKLDKIIKTVNFYLSSKNIELKFCIDAVIINGEFIEFIENITI